MAKKTFKDSTAHLDRFFSDIDGTHKTHDTHKTHNTYDAHKTQRTHGTQAPELKPKHYRLNLKLKLEHKEYLEQVSWEARKSVTQYLNDLIEADRTERNGR